MNNIQILRYDLVHFARLRSCMLNIFVDTLDPMIDLQSYQILNKNCSIIQ